jgi:NAD-dependent deacetylase
MTDASMDFPVALIERLRTARRVVVLTGAGVSAESGVPTFRDAQTGLWAKFRPEELATPEAFRANPGLVWDWYEWRRSLIRGARPHAGHLVIADWERRFPEFLLITQNVDGLHQVAGSCSIASLHGDILRTKCFHGCGPVESWAKDGDSPPRCAQCGGPLRPDVVWFGEALPEEALQAAARAATDCDAFFSIGTSSLVHPAASLIELAFRAGAVTVEVNPGDTPHSGRVDFRLRAAAGICLPALSAAVWPDPAG